MTHKILVLSLFLALRGSPFLPSPFCFIRKSLPHTHFSNFGLRWDILCISLISYFFFPASSQSSPWSESDLLTGLKTLKLNQSGNCDLRGYQKQNYQKSWFLLFAKIVLCPYSLFKYSGLPHLCWAFKIHTTLIFLFSHRERMGGIEMSKWQGKCLRIHEVMKNRMHFQSDWKQWKMNTVVPEVSLVNSIWQFIVLHVVMKLLL